MAKFERHVRSGRAFLLPVKECYHLAGEGMPEKREKYDLPLGTVTRCRCGRWFKLCGAMDPHHRYWRMVSKRQQRRLEREWRA